MPVKTAKKRKKGKGMFVKGDPRINRKGRPKGSGISITTEIKRALEKVPKGDKRTYLELLIAKILKRAIKDGSVKMINTVWDRIDGSVPRTFKGDPENPLFPTTEVYSKKGEKIAREYEEKLRKELLEK